MARFWRRWLKGGAGGGIETPAPAAALHSSNAGQQAAVVDHVEEAVLLVQGSAVRWLNPAARLMFPALEHPVGRTLVEVVRDHRMDSLAVRAHEAGLEQAAEIELPSSGRRLQVRALPLNDGGIAVLVQDVTRLRHLETVRQQFVANLSHEIRTPLAGLDLAAQTLSAQLPADGDTRLFIDRITQEAGRLADIVFNLNQLAALDAEGIAVERLPFSVDDLGRALARIFERFYKVDRSRGGQPGSGLGLSIARHLVELQGGTILAESTPGAGTVLRVRLPRAPLMSP